MTLLEMYSNIIKKFGKDSLQARKFKIYCETLPKGYYQKINLIYKVMMGE